MSTTLKVPKNWWMMVVSCTYVHMQEMVDEEDAELKKLRKEMGVSV